MTSVPQTSVAKRSFASILALMLREMATNYGRSPGGYIWAILEPVAGIVLMTILFSLAFRQPPLGTSFALFYATGMLPFTIYRDMSTKIERSISFSEKLLFYPAVTFMDAILARLILNTLTHVVVIIIILGSILMLTEQHEILDFSSIFLAFLAALVLSFGIGVFNMVIVMKVPVWQQIWRILNRPMFLISSIFFLYDSSPEPFRSYLWYNPLVHIIGLMRRGVYATYDAQFVSMTYVFAPSLALAAFGLLLLRRMQNEDR